MTMSFLDIAIALGVKKDEEMGGYNGADLWEHNLPIMSVCVSCGATLAAYNSYPARDGYIYCAEDHPEDVSGFTDIGQWLRFASPTGNVTVEDYTLQVGANPLDLPDLSWEGMKSGTYNQALRDNRVVSVIDIGGSDDYIVMSGWKVVNVVHRAIIPGCDMPTNVSAHPECDLRADWEVPYSHDAHLEDDILVVETSMSKMGEADGDNTYWCHTHAMELELDDGIDIDYR